MHFKMCELNIQLVILVNITAMFRTYRTYLAHLGIYTLRQDKTGNPLFYKHKQREHADSSSS